MGTKIKRMKLDSWGIKYVVEILLYNISVVYSSEICVVFYI